eukprot:gnl/TRDRNA2_/TRDRNA2_190017_c0_seq1.p1 gnl/TRDRNA2_/TRDRNA2_190017_c0~~gnl/TRDRNA2_/TRDRNA2_190017_c0_seq1.p1  ORF type:complete len:144 (+),score=26.41 gnl/TRDRNA2_/TRDRNA2_190017_c0_seq1:81-512(+)
MPSLSSAYLPLDHVHSRRAAAASAFADHEPKGYEMPKAGEDAKGGSASGSGSGGGSGLPKPEPPRQGKTRHSPQGSPQEAGPQFGSPFLCYPMVGLTPPASAPMSPYEGSAPLAPTELALLPPPMAMGSSRVWRRRPRHGDFL